MKQVILNIPDSNYDFFIELMKKLNFNPIDSSDDEIPEDIQQKVLERVKHSNREELLTWQEVKSKLRY